MAVTVISFVGAMTGWMYHEQCPYRVIYENGGRYYEHSSTNEFVKLNRTVSRKWE